MNRSPVKRHMIRAKNTLMRLSSGTTTDLGASQSYQALRVQISRQAAPSSISTTRASCTISSASGNTTMSILSVHTRASSTPRLLHLRKLARPTDLFKTRPISFSKKAKHSTWYKVSGSTRMRKAR